MIDDFYSLVPDPPLGFLFSCHAGQGGGESIVIKSSRGRRFMVLYLLSVPPPHAVTWKKKPNSM